MFRLARCEGFYWCFFFMKVAWWFKAVIDSPTVPSSTRWDTCSVCSTSTHGVSEFALHRSLFWERAFVGDRRPSRRYQPDADQSALPRPDRGRGRVRTPSTAPKSVKRSWVHPSQITWATQVSLHCSGVAKGVGLGVRCPHEFSEFYL